MNSQNKVTNATSDRDLILIWLGGKSETTQISYNSTVTKFIEFIDKPLAEVKLEDLQLWERGLKARLPTAIRHRRAMANRQSRLSLPLWRTRF